MKRFRFRFSALLSFRKRREEDALRALGSAQRAYQAEISQKEKLLDDLSQALARREALGNIATPASVFRLEDDFITGTKQRITWAGQAITRAGRGVEKALRAYLHAKRQTRAIELLYEKDFAAFKREVQKREARELDDLTIMRARFKEEEVA